MNKRKFKQWKKEDAHTPLLLLIGVLIAVAAVGIVKLFYQGNAAIKSLEITFEEGDDKRTSQARSERLKMSRDLDENGRYVLVEQPLQGSVTTKDGRYLWGPLTNNTAEVKDGLASMRNEKQTMGAEWRTLVGLSSDIGYGWSSSYLLDCYKDQIYGELEFSLLKGIRCKRSPNLKLNMNSKVQKEVYTYLKENGIHGSVTAYDYTTGEILCLASYGEKDGKELVSNNCLKNTSPGSTMKTITLLLLEQQGKAPKDLSYQCNGSYTLREDGKVITCTEKKIN